MNYVLVIDSGVGGVSILKELRKKFPSENFLYVLDNKFCPYGNKPKILLRKHIHKLICSFLQMYNIKLIVLACNTLTATTISYLRKKFKLNFVGTEPPIRKADKDEKTLLIATKQTIKNSKLLKKYKGNKKVKFVALKKVAKLLDENFYDRKKIIKSLEKQIKQKNFQNVVLGCTHYYFLKKEIEEVLGHRVNFFSATSGVVKRCENYLTSKNEKSGTIQICLTKSDQNLKKTVENILQN